MNKGFALRKRQTHSAWHLTKYFHCFSCRKQVSSIAGRSAKETLFRRPASLTRSLQQQQQQKIYTPNNKSIHTISHTFATGLRRFQLLQKPPFTNLPWYDWNLICGLCCFEMDMLRKIPWFLKKKNEKGKKKLGIIISSEPGAFSRGTRALKVSVFLVSTFCMNPICAFVLRRLFLTPTHRRAKKRKRRLKTVYPSEKKRVKQCNPVRYLLGSILRLSWKDLVLGENAILYRGELEVFIYFFCIFFFFSEKICSRHFSSHEDEKKLSERGANLNRKICGYMGEFYTTRITFQMTPVLECNSALGLFDCLGLSGLSVMWQCSSGHGPNS